MKLISDKVFEELQSIDDLINLCATIDGRKVADFGDADTFVSRFEFFKKRLKEEMPEFTQEEILKIYCLFDKIKYIFEWRGHHHYMSALEFELRDKERKATNE